MLFNSLEFLLFFPIVYILYWFVFNKNLRNQNILIMVASYLFYGWWSWKFLFLLFISTLLDYLYGFGVASPNRKKARMFLWLSVVNNLGILGVFKYYNFFAVEFQRAFEAVGIHTNPTLLNIALPVGISFYTFHGMSYVFDLYRKKREPVTNFIDYAVFVSFFPLLVAGPIERADHLLPQVQRPRVFDYRQSVDGCRLLLWGMFKKVVIADTLAVVADNCFNDYTHLGAFPLIIGVLAFSFQIYGDFSGYSDIAIGTSKMFGFELLSNFKVPYFSRNIAEFWRRWHISLSSWFRDYLYIPLGGSKGGKWMSVRNVFIIFLVSGFWHGASWNFIIWGFIHACCFLPLLLADRNRAYVSEVVAQNRMLPNMKELMQMIATFGIVCLAWIFFRAPDISTSVGYIQRIVQDAIHHPSQFLKMPVGAKTLLMYSLPLLFIDWKIRRDTRDVVYFKNKIVVNIILFITIYFLLQQIVLKENTSFIYFQF